MYVLTIGDEKRALGTALNGERYVEGLEKKFGNKPIFLSEFTKDVEQICVIFEIKSNRTSSSWRGVLVMHCDF